MRLSTRRALGFAFVLAASAVPGAAGAQDLGTAISNIFKYGGTTVPPSAPRQEDEVYCPGVGVIEGGAAVQSYTGGRTGDASSLRHQVSLGHLARECVARGDGTIHIKVGLEARALLGPAGAPGRLDVPVTVIVKRGERILSSKTQRVSVAIPQGSTQAQVVVVQDGLVVPPNVGEYEIDVGFVAGAGGKPEGSTRRGKRG
jgi:hypothetical protein